MSETRMRDWLLTEMRSIWPDGPDWFLTTLARLLANPQLTSDALLILADALDEARTAAEADADPTLALRLRAIGELPRMLAPHRVTP